MSQMSAKQVEALAAKIAAMVEEHGAPNKFSATELCGDDIGSPMRVGRYLVNAGNPHETPENRFHSLNLHLAAFGLRVTAYSRASWGGGGGLAVDRIVRMAA